MKEVFICYRRADSEVVTGRIYDDIAGVIGEEHVFKDVHAIPAGEDFRAVIESALSEAKCVIAVIGKNWLQEDVEGVSRINRDDDYVRAEIQTALEKNIPIIPVLVEGSEMPSPDSLEGDLKEVAFLNALPVRTDPDYKSDVNRLTARLREVTNLPDRTGKKGVGWAVSIVGLLLASLVGWLAYNSLIGPDADAGGDPPPPPEKVVIRVGIKQWVGYTPLAVAKELDLFPDDIEVTFHDVTSVGDMNRDLKDGDIDVSLGLVETHVRAAEQYDGREAADNPNRPVAFLMLDTSLGADGIVAKKEIQSVADLGMADDGTVRRFLYQKHDVSHFLFLVLSKEYAENVVEEENDEQKASRRSFHFRDLKAHGDPTDVQAAAKVFVDNPDGRYYAVGTYEPYMSSILKDDDNHLLIHSGSPSVRGLVVDIMVTKKKFLDENPQAIRSLVKGWFAAAALLNDKENARDDVLDLAFKFNGTTTDNSPWSAKTWTTNVPCSPDEYSLYLSGLTDEENTTPWPTIKENREFFHSWDGHPSKFERVFDRCKEHREGKDLSELSGHNFQAFSDVFSDE